jgi:cytochrome oxidase Cu insertion factor (SCO1/SenC/PrrC family)
VLRISFGLLWILDGILQTQQSMPLGLPTQVVGPAESGSPGWVQHLVNDGLGIWTRHPIPAATSAVWIQVGIGVLLLLAPRGRFSQAAGVASAGWGLLVWIFGEAFGGIFAPGLSWLFGAPGAAIFYVAAGLLLALPERSWGDRRMGRIVLGAVGLLWIAFAVLQAWPGRGFWQGHAAAHRPAGALAAMAQSMATTPQPDWLSSLISSFARFDGRHGWGVNLFVVASLVAIGVGVLSGSRRITSVAVAYNTVFSLAVWVVVQDLGFLGGVGTDPNSMIPAALILGVGWLAWARVPVTVDDVVATQAESEVAVAPSEVIDLVGAGGLGGRLAPARVRLGLAAGTVLGAVGIVLVGAVPMASASLNPHTDVIVTEGVNGQPQQTDTPAGSFQLVDQRNAPVSLASLRGKTIALTFLDPVCTTDCPLMAQEFRDVDSRIGAPGKTAFIAVVANPIYRSVKFVQAFDAQENFGSVPNWYYLTGSQRELSKVWARYGIEVQVLGGGAMVAHSEIAYVIDPSGKLREVLGADPGPDNTSSASFVTLLTSEMRSVMHT